MGDYRDDMEVVLRLDGEWINDNQVRPARRSGLCGICSNAFVLDEPIVWCHELKQPAWSHADCARELASTGGDE